MFLIGNSVDIHRIEKQENYIKQKLAGINVYTTYKIIAHSDGDIILHSIIEAILGALGFGDLGEHFSDLDERFKGIDSSLMLNEILNLMSKYSYKINNIDITLISEHIFLKDYKYLMRLNLMKLLKTKNVSLKATRWEEDKKIIQCNCSILLKTII